MSEAKRDDGGPAFPCVTGGKLDATDSHGRRNIEFDLADGMTLRDWLAGQALPQSLIDTQLESGGSDAAAAAHYAYEIADAMLAERSKQP